MLQSAAISISTDVLEFLRSQPLTASFTENELEAMASIAELRRYEDGDVLVREGVSSHSLFFLFHGTVDVCKGAERLPDPEDSLPDEYSIVHLEKGAVIGEMELVDGRPASATVRAAGDCEVLVVTHERLDLASQQVPALRMKLLAAVAGAVVQRLRQTSEYHVSSLHAQLRETRLRQQFASFFVVTMILFGIASTVQKLINPGLPPLWQMLYSWGFLLLSFAPICWFVWRLRLRPESWGLTFRNGPRSSVEALVLGSLLAALAALLRGLLKPADAPFIAWGSLATYPKAEFLAFFLAYGPHSFLQELIGRGVIQGSLERFLPDAKAAVPILLTSALFAMFHLYVSVAFGALTFVVSVLFGWLYRRHGTLVGVTVLHYVIGFASIALGFN